MAAAGPVEWKESEMGRIFKVSGPLVVAEEMRGAFMHELVRVGEQKIVGEIIKIEGDTASVQCYEDTSGLRVGDIVTRHKKPLSVLLGPGIMETIFDGIQRPLKVIFDECKGDPFVPLGVDVPPLDTVKKWPYWPAGVRTARGWFAGDVTRQFRPGDLVTGGTVIGEVYENELLPRHKILIPPGVFGEVVEVYGLATTGQAEFNILEPVMKVRRGDSGEIVDIALAHEWPVRKSRPVAEKLPGEEALITGQRVIDMLFPSVLGGTCAIPGAFGCGKTCISQALSKYSNTDCIIYVGCGERGNEMAEVLAEFPELTTKVDGKEVGILKRTCLVANTSNMPVAAREASIYTGITIAEYFRDQGMHVAMMADSTSRWAEALREISGRLGEMPADGGYPAYLSARLARFYERAGLARCLGSPERKGSVTVVGAVSPPGGDFSDPVTAATLGIVQVFWGLDKKLAQRKHFPSLNWNISYTKYKRVLDPFFDNLSDHKDYSKLRDKASNILQTETELQEIVQLVGEDSLSAEQKLTLEVAKIIREDFLQQDAFSEHDYNCPLTKSLAMLRTIVRLYDRADRAILDSGADGASGGGGGGGGGSAGGDASTAFTWHTLQSHHQDLIDRVTRMKFIDPATPEEELEAFFGSLNDDIDAVFDALADELAR